MESTPGGRRPPEKPRKGPDAMTTQTITAADVEAEGNILVILPWDGRIGEIYDDGPRPCGVDKWYHSYGLRGLNCDRAPNHFNQHGRWESITQDYARWGTDIRRAPEGAELGDLV